MNAPELMRICQKLAPMLKHTPKEVWKLMDVRLSYTIGKPQIDLVKLDEFLQPYDEDKFSMSEVLTERYGKESCEYIETMV